MKSAWVVATVMAIGMLPGRAPGQLPPRSGDYFLDGADSVSLTVHLDRLGFVAPAAGESSALAYADSLGLTLRRRFPGGFLEFSLRDSLSRDSLRHLARAIRRQREAQGKILRVGLIVSARGTDAPMIVTDQIIVRFAPRTRPSTIDSLNRILGVRVLRPFAPPRRDALVELPDSSSHDAVTGSRVYARSGSVIYAVPNFAHVILSTGVWNSEPLFQEQWHLENTGQGGGTPDADVDAEGAWGLTLGDAVARPVIAVLDQGFDVDHEDLRDNLWTNPNEGTCNGIDEDASQFAYDYTDDLHGWDFFGCVVGCNTTIEACIRCGANPGSSTECATTKDPGTCGQLRIDVDCQGLTCPDLHGTAVAGIAAARGDNTSGGTGLAPRARLMLIRYDFDEDGIARAFDYARERGADVINCSWKPLEGDELTSAIEVAVRTAATEGRGGRGCIIVYSMSDEDVRDDTSASSIYEIEREPGVDLRDAVIAVSGSDNKDRKACATGRGDCLDLLAPAHGGTRRIVTADHSGTPGYNSALWSPCLSVSCDGGTGSYVEVAAVGYTGRFTGTSASAPMVAGAAGLVLSVEPEVTQIQLKRLLQDTADKIEPESGSAAANYDSKTGFSAGAGDGSTHGWGRLNVFEAVRIAAPPSLRGKNGIDVFARDHDLDWGNTEQPTNVVFEPTRGWVGHWKSVDIKVDAGPVWQTEPKTAAEFESMTDEPPSIGANRVYVRLRNRGFRSAASVDVKLHWAFAGTSLPPLPSDFWTRFPDDPTATSSWNPIGRVTLRSLEYSGATATRPPETGPGGVARFDFTPPSSAGGPIHYCLLAILDTQHDRPGPKDRVGAAGSAPEDLDVDRLTPSDNNIVQRNIIVEEISQNMNFRWAFYIRNPHDVRREYFMRWSLPTGWKIRDLPRGPLKLKPREERLVTITGTRRSANPEGSIEIVQELVDGKRRTPVGGLTIQFVGPRESVR